MKCRICGCEAPKGAKLCKDCASARKRAFAATVTQPLLLAAAGAPSVTQPRFAPKPRPKNPQSRSPAIGPVQTPPESEGKTVVAPRVSPRRRRSLAGPLVAAVGAAGVLLLVAIVVVANRRNNHDTGAEATVAAPGPAVAVPQPAVPVTPPQAASSSASPGETELVGPPAPAHRPRARKPAVVEPPVTPVIVPQVVAVEPPPRPVAQATRLAEPARIDPLQVLNDALAGCARRDMLDRPSCEQRARVQYCGSSWGQIPQCPIGPGTDHGQ